MVTDPPYNTGKDFIYKDNFTEDKADFLERDEQYDEQGNRLTTNLESNGRFHTDWLNMIYPRLKLAKDLLSDDGVIFISIDDNEVHNCRKIMDEIFGNQNLIAEICHKSHASISNDKIISPNHNIILFYAKNYDEIHKNRKYYGLDPNLDGFNEHDNNGEFRLVPVDGPGGAKKGNPFYKFLDIEGYWRFSKETMQDKYNKGLVIKRGNSLYQKYYKSTASTTRRTDTTWWEDGGLISTATTNLKKLMENETFDTPKPLELIIRMLKITTFIKKDSLILDFFSGSATTAHAVMQLNAEDGGKRQFIMVQLPEVCDKNSEAYKAGYKNICEIGKERIRRAAKKIREENPDATFDDGFRVLKLDSSNMKDVYYKPEQYAQMSFDVTNLADNIKEDRTEEDLLFQVMLELGVPLSSKIIKENGIFNVNDGYVLAVFGQVSENTLTEMAKQNPVYAVFRDACFADNSAKTNMEQIFKTYAPDTAIKVL